MMKIGCGTVSFRKLPLEEALARIAAAGYEYVEPQATAPFCPHVDPWNDDPMAFRRRVESLGFKGASALWASNGAIIRDPESVSGVSRCIEWASEAGIPVVNAGDGKKPDDLSDEEALKRLGDRLGRILEVAERCGVYLAIEPHGTFSLTTGGLQAIMALSSSKWLGINYDAANVHRATYVETVAGNYSWTPYGQQQDEVATLRVVAGRVVHVHVKDLKGAECVALGDGEVDNLSCLQVLREHGYHGVLSLETEGNCSPEESQALITRSRQYLLDALNQVTGIETAS